MKKYLIAFIAYVLIIFNFYAFGAIGYWSYNPGDWEEVGRGCLAATGIITGIIVAVGIICYYVDLKEINS